MEKNELVDWENKCIQEEPPECMAACPLHVDARLFIKFVAVGDWDAAHKVLNKVMPFPGILGRVCDHPCEQKCKRSEVDEPLAIGALERRCVEIFRGKKRVQLLPAKGKQIAVVGAGLSGLTAAFELLKKGFAVSIFESSDRLGGHLWNLPEDILPRSVMLEELVVLEDLKADIRLDISLDGASFDQICRDYAAVYFDRGSLCEVGDSLQRDGNGLILMDSVTGATNMAGVFAGGGTSLVGTYSPVFETLAGKKGALSIERFLQQSKIDHAREQEGPFKTRLYTRTEGIVPIPRVRTSEGRVGLSDEEALQEAARCMQCECMECVKACLYLERYRSYPKKYARELFNNEHVLYGSSRTKNLFLNSCSSCGRCASVCPGGFDMGDLSLQARRTAVAQRFMPPSFHEFALQDMMHSCSEHFALHKHQPGADQSAWLFFPSCQLCATSPAEVMAAYRFLGERLLGGVGIMLGCCGAPAWWAGREDLFSESVAAMRSDWESMGRPRVITACATCESVFKDNIPEMAPVSLWNILEEIGLPAVTARRGSTMAVADPCMTRQFPETHAVVRRLLHSLGISITELHGDNASPECCGYGGLMFNANPALAKDVVAHRTRHVEPPTTDKPFSAPVGWHRMSLLANADTAYYQTVVSTCDYLAYCAMCRDNLAAAGKRTAHLLELLFPVGEGVDPAARGWISWSERRSNRVRVKEEMLRCLGIDGTVLMEYYKKIKLHIAPEVLRRIDERRILEDDIRKVIDHAERSGRRMRNLESDSLLAYLQPENVTFWVEYSPGDDGFVVHNAYCHRMRIVGIKQ
jgi:glutamate synthase (NADPH) small chain